MPTVEGKGLRRLGQGTRSGVPRQSPTVKDHADGSSISPYGWSMDVAGTISLSGFRLLLANRAGVRIRCPLRLT
jgi:hypothetical protein